MALTDPVPSDPKRDLLRHMVATVAFRGGVAIRDAPDDFAEFRITAETRSPAEILAHIGDLLVGSYHLLKGEFIELRSEPLSWNAETERFYSAVRQLDAFLSTDSPLAYPPEQMVQGPIGDALTHVGQIVILRRIAGCPIAEEAYFVAEVVPGSF
jgi:hypothetical protein